jgi:hypothetical protein
METCLFRIRVAGCREERRLRERHVALRSVLHSGSVIGRIGVARPSRRNPTEPDRIPIAKARLVGTEGPMTWPESAGITDR